MYNTCNDNVMDRIVYEREERRGILFATIMFYIYIAVSYLGQIVNYHDLTNEIYNESSIWKSSRRGVEEFWAIRQMLTISIEREGLHCIPSVC